VPTREKIMGLGTVRQTKNLSEIMLFFRLLDDKDSLDISQFREAQVAPGVASAGGTTGKTLVFYRQKPCVSAESLAQMLHGAGIFHQHLP
jgi:hypothetical protein